MACLLHKHEVPEKPPVVIPEATGNMQQGGEINIPTPSTLGTQECPTTCNKKRGPFFVSPSITIPAQLHISFSSQGFVNVGITRLPGGGGGVIAQQSVTWGRMSHTRHTHWQTLRQWQSFQGVEVESLTQCHINFDTSYKIVRHVSNKVARHVSNEWNYLVRHVSNGGNSTPTVIWRLPKSSDTFDTRLTKLWDTCLTIL